MSLVAPERANLSNWSFAGPIAGAFEFERGPVTMIQGPTGGGKSTASARRCLRVAMWQQPSPRDGIRKARIICICPTYRRAWDQVMPSFFKVFPIGMQGSSFRGSRGDPADYTFDIVVNIDGHAAPLHVEVLFRAVNDLDIEEFFRGFEFTAIWLPEADTNGDLDTLISLGSNRVGRYPEPEDRPLDGDAAYAGIFGDANAPIIGSPFHRRFHMRKMPDGKLAPPTDRLYVQPSGFSANAENMHNLRRIRRDYYEHMASQLDDYDVGRMIKNKAGVGRHGQPVHPNFDHETHVAKRSLDPDPYSTVIIGVDAGSGSLVPGATFSQRTPGGQWRTFAEIHLDDGQMTLPELGENIRTILNSRFPMLKRDVGAVLTGDPALRAVSSGSEYAYSEGQILQAAANVELTLAPTNNPKLRRAPMNRLFKTMISPREPAKIIDPACVGLIQGYAGGFHYRKRASGQGISPTPEKNGHAGRFSHVCEADEYGPLTMEGIEVGEDRMLGINGRDAGDSLKVLHGD